MGPRKVPRGLKLCIVIYYGGIAALRVSIFCCCKSGWQKIVSGAKNAGPAAGWGRRGTGPVGPWAGAPTAQNHGKSKDLMKSAILCYVSFLYSKRIIFCYV